MQQSPWSEFSELYEKDIIFRTLVDTAPNIYDYPEYMGAVDKQKYGWIIHWSYDEDLSYYNERFRNLPEKVPRKEGGDASFHMWVFPKKEFPTLKELRDFFRKHECIAEEDDYPQQVSDEEMRVYFACEYKWFLTKFTDYNAKENQKIQLEYRDGKVWISMKDVMENTAAWCHGWDIPAGCGDYRMYSPSGKDEYLRLLWILKVDGEEFTYMCEDDDNYIWINCCNT